MGNSNFTASPSGAFKTGEGLLNIAANKQEQFVALAGLIGRPDLVEDPRFAAREDRKKNRAALTAEVEAGLASRSAAEWETLLNQAGVPSGRVLSVPQALALPQVQQRGLVKNMGRREGLDRDIQVMRSGFTIEDAEPDVDLPPPWLGEHTDFILSELGYDATEIAALHERGDV